MVLRFEQISGTASLSETTEFGADGNTFGSVHCGHLSAGEAPGHESGKGSTLKAGATIFFQQESLIQ